MSTPSIRNLFRSIPPAELGEEREFEEMRLKPPDPDGFIDFDPAAGVHTVLIKRQWNGTGWADKDGRVYRG